jgi:hypothetical protein
LLIQKPTEKLDKSVTFIFTNKASEVRERIPSASPANPPITPTMEHPTSGERSIIPRRHTVEPVVQRTPHESRIRNKLDFYDEHKKTHKKSGS